MKEKQEKFFALLEDMDKPNLEILKSVAEEIDHQLQRSDTGKVYISIMPDDFSGLADITRENGTSFNWIKNEQEKEKDRKLAIKFLKDLGAMKTSKKREGKIWIEANKKSFESCFNIIKEKLENIIQKEKPTEFFYCRGTIFHHEDIVYHPDSREKHTLLEKLWLNRTEIKDNTTILHGTKLPTDDCMTILKLPNKPKTRDAINKIESAINKKCTQITIDGSDGDGYLMTLNSSE